MYKGFAFQLTWKKTEYFILCRDQLKLLTKRVTAHQFFQFFKGLVQVLGV